MSSKYFRIQEHVISSQYIREYPGGTAYDQEVDLKLHIKQYIPLDSSKVHPGSVTIIGAHANGFPKELFEPLWDEMYQRSEANGFSIRNIWIADVAHQGQSLLVNEHDLGNDPSWLDHSRDLLHMVNHFRAEMLRPLVGIGHSMGGAQLVNLSLMHPRLLTTLILLDPVMQLSNETSGSAHDKYGVATMSAFRRDLWPSRQAAAASFAKSPYYQKWDKRVLDLWLKFGLRDLPTALHPDIHADGHADSSVTLATTKHQEVWTFIRPNFAKLDSRGTPILDRGATPDLFSNDLNAYPFYRPEPVSIFLQLPQLRPSVLYIFGDTSNMSAPNLRDAKVATTGTGVGGSGGIANGRVEQILLPGIGHLVPLEAVADTAKGCANWIGKEFSRWQVQEGQWKELCRARDRKENLMISEEFISYIGGPPNRQKAREPAKL